MMQPDPLASSPSLALWAIVVSVLLVLLVGGIKLFKHSNATIIGAVLFGLAIVPLFLLGMTLLGTWASYQSVSEVPEVVHKAIDGVEQVTDNLSDTLGDLEKELDEFTKPKIELGEEAETPATEEEPAEEESSTELKTEPKLGEPLPAWVTDPPEGEEGVWQRIVTTEPCFTMESLSQEQGKLFKKTVSQYLTEKVDSEIPVVLSSWLEKVGDFPSDIFRQHTEKRETSVGEAFVSHLLFRIEPSDKEWFVQQWEAWKVEQYQANHGTRVAGVGLLSGAVLCVLAALYGLLRISEK